MYWWCCVKSQSRSGQLIQPVTYDQFSFFSCAQSSIDKRAVLTGLASQPCDASTRACSNVRRFASLMRTPRWRNASRRASVVNRRISSIRALAALVPPPRVHLTRYHGVLTGRGA
jgi:hypothetical protein